MRIQGVHSGVVVRTTAIPLLNFRFVSLWNFPTVCKTTDRLTVSPTRRRHFVIQNVSPYLVRPFEADKVNLISRSKRQANLDNLSSRFIERQPRRWAAILSNRGRWSEQSRSVNGLQTVWEQPPNSFPIISGSFGWFRVVSYMVRIFFRILMLLFDSYAFGSFGFQCVLSISICLFSLLLSLS